MRTPDTLTALVDHGIIDEVVRPLMSGKEAQVYLVLSGGEQRVAKIYKEAQNRSFQNRADYTEGRKVRNSRDQRAMGRNSRHGKAQNEAAWRSAEVDMIYRLRDAGVRVPNPYHFIDGVLIMELVVDAEGFPAPRLGDLVWEPADASALFKQLLGEVVRMLSIGVVHGDLSDFNVLMSASGPVVIDFPQSVDAATNANARKLLLRDVENLNRFAAKFDPTHSPLPYAEEMWELYKRNALTPETQLSGRFKGTQKVADTKAVLGLISDANKDERRRREAHGLSMRGTSPDKNEPPASSSAEGNFSRGERPAREQESRRGLVGREPRERASEGAPGHRAPARVDTPARSRVDAPPRPRVDAPPRARVDAPPRSRVDAPPRPRVDAPARSRVDAPPHSRADEPPHSRVDAPPRSRVDAPPHSRADEPRSRDAVPRSRHDAPRSHHDAPRSRDDAPRDRAVRPGVHDRDGGVRAAGERALPDEARRDRPAPRNFDLQPPLGERAQRQHAQDRPRDERRLSDNDPRGRAEGQSRAGGQSVSRPGERRVSSFGERVQYRGQHGESGQSGPDQPDRDGSAPVRHAQRDHERPTPDRSSDLPKRPR